MSRRLAAAVASLALLTAAVGTMAWLVPAGATTSTAPAAAAALALANVGKGAGTCSTYNAAPNSLGGDAFESSCDGFDGLPEYWCADFVRWVWANSGLDAAGLTAAAASFVTSGVGTVHTDPSYVPVPGDAVVYDFDGHAYADHVGIVTSVNADGSVTTVNGDFSGSGSGAAFARTSHVQIAVLGVRHRAVGQTPGGVGMTITDYVTPRPDAVASPAAMVDAGGTPNLFWRSATGELEHSYDLGHGWAAPENLASGVFGDPAASSAPDVVYRTVDGLLARASFAGGSWQAGQVLPTGGVVVASDPSVTIDSSGIENVFFVGTDHVLWHDYLLGGAWQGPTPVATNVRSAPAAVTVPSGISVAFVTGGHVLAQTSFAAGAWSGTTALPVTGVVGSPTATVGSDGVVHVAWRQQGGSVDVGELSGGAWIGSMTIAGATRSTPVVLAQGATLDVASKVLGAPAIQDDLYDGASWSGASTVAGGQGIPGHPALFVVDGTLEVAWLTATGSLVGSTLVDGTLGPATQLLSP